MSLQTSEAFNFQRST